jgi:SAM-dependent methyltransferase
MAESDYFLGGTLTEQQRLEAQARAYEPETRWLLDRLGVRSGWRAVDVGCGPYGILPLLAERVGDRGTVVGLEPEPRFAAAATALVADRGLANTTIVAADAAASGLAPASFDLAHERLVLIQAADPAAVLAAMVALVRPGGVVAVEEFDSASWLCHPSHPAWDTLLRVFLTVGEEGGLDMAIGRKLPAMLRAAGLIEVEAEAHVRLDRPGEYRRTHLLALVASVREAILGRGLLGEAELDGLVAALRAHLEDPATVVVRQLLVQAWGRAPG